jgi:hypothetical protein
MKSKPNCFMRKLISTLVLLTFSVGTANSNFQSATYTPELTNHANVISSTAFVTGYFRVGDTVTVFGRVGIQANVAGVNTVLLMSLPVPTNFTDATQLGGSGSDGNVPIKIESFNPDKASFFFKPVLGTNHLLTYNFSFSYQVI